MNETKPTHFKYTLKEPVVLFDTDGNEKQRVTELVIRTKVVAGDMRGASMDLEQWDDFLKILSRLSGQPDVVINRIGVEDLGEVVPLVAGFMGRGPKAGSAPSP